MPVIIKNGTIKIRQILPIESVNINKQIINMSNLNDIKIHYKDDIVKSCVNYKVNWPIIKNYSISNIEWKLYAGEKERLRYEFVMDSKIDVLKIYTHFYENDPNKGWRESTLYIIQHKGDKK